MKTIEDVDVADRRVLVRVDLNVPLDDGRVADDTRIRAALPTLRHLVQRRARVVACSHLGRPGGEVVESLSLRPVGERLSELLAAPVRLVDDCVGPDVEAAVESLEPGELLLLENTRFHAGEKANDPDFADGLARLADLYVNDAFGTAHRAHASTEGVARRVPAVAGLLMAAEIEALERILSHPEHPFVAILGGAKISDKIGVVQRLLELADRLLVGGGMANTFLAARGIDVAESLLEEGSVETARRLLDHAGDALVLPVDAVVAMELAAGAETRTVPVEEVPSGWRILDVGPATVARFSEILSGARTVVWNGPLGAFEVEPFDAATDAVARLLADLEAVTVIGGGDSAAAVARAGLADRMTHVSTGGGAFLAYLEGVELPGLAALERE